MVRGTNRSVESRNLPFALDQQILIAEAIRNDKVVGYFGTAQAVPFPLSA